MDRPTDRLHEIDWRLLNFHPEGDDWASLQGVLETRGELVRELAEAASAAPDERGKAELERSIYAGEALTRKLAAYRRMLQNELLRANRYAPETEAPVR